MLVKGFIVLVLLVIVGSLGSGLFFMLRDHGQSHRTVRALTIRISLSLALFFLLMLAFATGLISPHPAVPPG
ncbi:MAG TPA: twin transmembrane helix small protein [Gammaproteobacteria bacterium]|nr:twin transmembrane helix small protein [Gammaproteobacteria bacterium]